MQNLAKWRLEGEINTKERLKGVTKHHEEGLFFKDGSSGCNKERLGKPKENLNSWKNSAFREGYTIEETIQCPNWSFYSLYNLYVSTSYPFLRCAYFHLEL